MIFVPVASMLEEDGDLGWFQVEDLLDIESTGSSTETDFVGDSIANVVVVIAFVEILPVICSDSRLGFGVEGFEPGGEVEPDWGGRDVDCRHSGGRNDDIRQIFVSTHRITIEFQVRDFSSAFSKEVREESMRHAEN
jgi:hypothetical protein